MNKNFFAWAISTEEHGFIGRYWRFHKDQPYYPPEHLRGCYIALFRTRKTARNNLPAVKGAFPKAKVVKVRVDIREVKYG